MQSQLIRENITREQILEIIAEHTREILPELDGQDIGPSDRLVELGANSVDRAEILMRVQESLDLTVPRVELYGPRNIGELAELLFEKLNAA